MTDPQVEWLEPDRLTVDGIRFILCPTSLSPEVRRLVAEGWLPLRKPRWMVDRYVDLARTARSSTDPVFVVELGIYGGASAVLHGMLFRPEKLLAIDLDEAKGPNVQAMLERVGMDGTIRAVFGVDQADRNRLEQLVDETFDGARVDVVIDDASHLYEPSRASFNCLFPKLRPGGRYVLEDWSVVHDMERQLAIRAEHDPTLREALANAAREAVDQGGADHPMSRLLLEIVVGAAYDQEVIDEVRSVTRGWAEVVRGTSDAPPATFDVAELAGLRGRSLLATGVARPRA